MRYTVHQMLVNLTANALVISLICSGGCSTTSMMVDRSLTAKGLVQKFIGFVDTVGNLGFDNRLTIKASHFYIFISSNNDAICFLDFLLSQYILGTAGAVGFYLNPDATLLGMLFQGLSSHKGMGNAGRAGSYSQNFVSAIYIWSGRSGSIDGFPVFFGINQGKEFIYGFGIYQSIGKVWIHQHGSQLAEKLQMSIIGVGRCGNQEKQTGWQTIHRIKISTSRYGNSSQTSFLHTSAFGMRSSNAIPKASGARGLTSQNILKILFLVGNLARLVHQINQLTDDVIFASWSSIQLNAFLA